MILFAALCGAAAVWVALPTPQARLARTLTPAPRERLSTPLVAALCVPLLAATIFGPLGFVAGLFAAPVVMAFMGRLSSRADRARERESTRQLPVAIDLIAAGLAAGGSPEAALRSVAASTPPPLGLELDELSKRLRGAPDRTAVWDTVPPSLEPAGRAFRRAESSGVAVTSLLAAAADESRRLRRAERQRVAASVAVRSAAPLGLCFLPAFFLVAIVPSIISVASTLSPW